ncbi:MarR family winged helix-turn-helix transcriptional regulator [Bradyrhizobium sp.]|uniref:MarR family winged helix-turn-helix transcriptional regulator n=1 Tax=Bradyrhizobium sp. TaxID=376 RepID=UPI0039E6375F
MSKSKRGGVDRRDDGATEVEHEAARRLADDFVLHRAPGYLLRQLDSRAAALYEAHTGQGDLTPRQFGVLLTLFQMGPLSQTELGNQLHLDRSTSGEMLQRMLERKLVSRQPRKEDRRAIEIVLTPQGRSALLKTVERASAAQQALLSPLPDYLRPVFVKCLQILAEADVTAASAQQNPNENQATIVGELPWVRPRQRPQ